MPDNQISRRVQLTRHALREAMISLITERPLASITVTDVCARADINRTTFYLHYHCVDDLLQEVEAQIIDHIGAQFDQPPSIETLSTAIYFLKNAPDAPQVRRLLYALIGEQGDPRFVRRLHQLTYETFQRAWQARLPEVDEARKMLVFSFIVPGVISVLYTWLQGDLPDMQAEDIVAQLSELIERGISSLS
ncbi:MAG: TetR/AcrR family transcriptional regulator C-terminal domain-containing protein [Eubacteriales bacterium]|nr:TetR/AcrR family transcriptional regulator C-terminal domain-containing protein [Eubacteriales bacterium]